MNNLDQIANFQIAVDSRIDTALASVWTALPCKITKIDWAQRTVSAQPQITLYKKEINSSKKIPVKMPLLINVPIVAPYGNKLMLHIPLAVEDEVLIIFSSRNIDNWFDGVPDEPAILRTLSLSDGFAVPGIFAKAAVPKDLPEDKIILGAQDLTIGLSINAQATIIQMTEDNMITLDKDGKLIVKIKGDISVETEGAATVKCKKDSVIEAEGNITVKGKNIKCEATSEVELKSGSMNIKISSSGVDINGGHLAVK